MSIEKILVIDDEVLVRDFLAETLRRKKYEVLTAENGAKGLAILEENPVDLVITDMKMPGMTGMEVLKNVKQLYPSMMVIVVTAFGSIENAVEAMKLGAFNYLIKPFSPDTIEAVIEKATEHMALVHENDYLRQQVSKGNGSRSIQQIITGSSVMKKILSDAERIAKSNASVFINGESGTGKEVIAHAIHFSSHRANKPYIRVNCAAVPETLVESEFFGHEKGAFTGANTKRIGRFELAHGGTLLLDEITEIPMHLQAKLLRVIQEQEFERVGGSKPVQVDVRLISTSNRNMEEAIEEKVFREDLYYRLNVVPINLPPLRDRRDDILPLAEYFCERICIENHKPRKRLDPSAQKKMLDYSWPGNIRELANIIERAVVMDYSDLIAAEHLYIDVMEKDRDYDSAAFQNETPGSNSTPMAVESSQLSAESFPAGLTLAELEKKLILETLQQKNNNRTHTADALGISIRTLRNKLNEYKTS
jgi:two-component system response regulator AtoC